MREFVASRVADGVPMEYLTGDEARALAPILPETVRRRLVLPARRPDRFAALRRAFANAAQRAGATIVEGAAVRTLEATGRRITRVETDQGPIAAGQVVLAAGAWTPYLGAQLGLDIPIHPMRLQIVQTEPMPPRLDVLLYGPAAVKQYSIFQELPSFRPETFATDLEDRLGLALLESACQSADGSYLLGCAMDYPGFDWQPSTRGRVARRRGPGGGHPGAARGPVRARLGRHPAVHDRQPADHRRGPRASTT